MDKMTSRAGLNGFADRIWPAGRSVEAPVLHSTTCLAYRLGPK